MTEYFFGNPRASNLRGKDLPEEFSWYEKKATLLAVIMQRFERFSLLPTAFA
jgi:hypothetical protein